MVRLVSGESPLRPCTRQAAVAIDGLLGSLAGQQKQQPCKEQAKRAIKHRHAELSKEIKKRRLRSKREPKHHRVARAGDKELSPQSLPPSLPSPPPLLLLLPTQQQQLLQQQHPLLQARRHGGGAKQHGGRSSPGAISMGDDGTFMTGAGSPMLPNIGDNPGSPTKCLMPQATLTMTAIAEHVRMPSRRWGRTRTTKAYERDQQLKRVQRQHRLLEEGEIQTLRESIEGKQKRIDRRNQQRAWLRLVAGSSAMVLAVRAVLTAHAAGKAAREQEERRQRSAVRLQAAIRAFAAKKLVTFRRRIACARWRMVVAVRTWRRCKRADLLVKFLRDHMGQVCRLQCLCYSVRNKFMWNVYTQHHFAKGWVECRAARLKALGRMWDRVWIEEAARRRKLAKRAAKRAASFMTEEEMEEGRAWRKTHRDMDKMLKKSFTKAQWDDLEARTTGAAAASGCPDALKWGILRHHLAVARHRHIQRSTPIYDQMKAREQAAKSGAREYGIEDMRKMMKQQQQLKKKKKNKRGRHGSAMDFGSNDVIAEWPMFMLYTTSRRTMRGLVLSAMQQVESIRHEPGRRRSVFQEVGALEVMHLERPHGIRTYSPRGGLRTLGIGQHPNQTPTPKGSPVTRERRIGMRRRSSYMAPPEEALAAGTAPEASRRASVNTRLLDAALVDNETPAAIGTERTIVLQLKTVFNNAERAIEEQEQAEAEERERRSEARQRKTKFAAGADQVVSGASSLAPRQGAKSGTARTTTFMLPAGAQWTAETAALMAREEAKAAAGGPTLLAAGPKLGVSRYERRKTAKLEKLQHDETEKLRIETAVQKEKKDAEQREKYSRRLTAKGAIGGGDFLNDKARKDTIKQKSALKRSTSTRRRNSVGRSGAVGGRGGAGGAGAAAAAVRRAAEGARNAVRFGGQ